MSEAPLRALISRAVLTDLSGHKKGQHKASKFQWKNSGKRTSPRTFNPNRKAQDGAPFAYNCLGCKREFFDGIRRNQNCCGDEACKQIRDGMYAEERARIARERREAKIARDVDQRISEIWHAKKERVLPDGVIVHESYADMEEAYYTAGLTPMQMRTRAAKNAARLAELKEDLKRMGSKL